jgi:hypothetical protein
MHERLVPEPATERAERAPIREQAEVERRPTPTTPVDVARCSSGALDTAFDSPATASRISRSPSPVRRSPIAARVRVDRRQVIRRNAATWQSWAQTNLAGETHTFEDEGGLVVINKALDVSEAYLKNVQARPTGTDDLKALIRAAAELRKQGYDVSKMTDPHKTNVTKWQSSSGGRMRFRGAIGPTAGPGSTTPGTSIVEKFITEKIEPLWRPLPDFLTTGLTPQSRSRLYDLPNSSHKDTELLAGMRWAKAQGAQSVAQLVNFTEYHIAMQGELETEAEKAAAAEIEDKRTKKTLEQVTDDNDPRVVAEAKKIAKNAEIRKLTDLVSKTYFPKVKTPGINATDVDEVDKLGIKIKVGITVPDFKKAIEAAAEATVSVSTYDMKEPTRLAKQAVQEGLDAKAKDLLATAHAQRLRNELGTRFSQERGAVTTGGYAGTGPAIAGWDAAPEGSKPDLIKAKAKETNKIPFFTNDAAVYHGLKHYDDIKFTEDKAPSADKKVEAYLASATKTVANPSKVETQFNQTGAGPSYFFFRDVPSDKPSGKPKKMRAIVVVGADGRVNIATYFAST